MKKVCHWGLFISERRKYLLSKWWLKCCILYEMHRLLSATWTLQCSTEARVWSFESQPPMGGRKYFSNDNQKRQVPSSDRQTDFVRFVDFRNYYRNRHYYGTWKPCSTFYRQLDGAFITSHLSKNWSKNIFGGEWQNTIEQHFQNCLKFILMPNGKKRSSDGEARWLFFLDKPWRQCLTFFCTLEGATDF